MARQGREESVIVGVGLDLVSVARAERMISRHGARLLSRCCAAGEVVRPEDPGHIAGVLAAKEAAFKALGSGWGMGVGWRDPVVSRTPEGAPRLTLTGAAASLAETLGVRSIHLSITHAAGVAVAVVILEG